MARRTREQTAVKLPRTVRHTKVKIPEHPLVDLIDDIGVDDAAKAVGIDRTTMYHHLKRAKLNRDYLVMAEMVLPLYEAGGLHPYYWRPDLYPAIGVPPA